MNGPALTLLAKKPLPGLVKTRLLPHLTAEQAAELAMMMLAETVANAVRHWRGPVSLLISPDPDHPDLIELASEFNLPMSAQSPGDLGQKMEEALIYGLERAPAAAVMGCDLPHITGSLLAYASAKLDAGANVIGPAADGGFFFAGIQTGAPGLFANIQWSTATVFAQALKSAVKVGLHYDVVLPCQQDIDEIEDLIFLAQQCPRYQKFLNESPGRDKSPRNDVTHPI